MLRKLGQISTDTHGGDGLDPDSTLGQHKQYTNGAGEVSNIRSPEFPFTVANAH
jgi:hypothetical protein